LEQAEQELEQELHYPFDKNYPDGQPGAHVVSDSKYPALHEEH